MLVDNARTSMIRVYVYVPFLVTETQIEIMNHDFEFLIVHVKMPSSNAFFSEVSSTWYDRYYLMFYV